MYTCNNIWQSPIAFERINAFALKILPFKVEISVVGYVRHMQKEIRLTFFDYELSFRGTKLIRYLALISPVVSLGCLSQSKVR